MHKLIKLTKSYRNITYRCQCKGWEADRQAADCTSEQPDPIEP